MTDLYAHTPSPGNNDWHLLLDHLIAVAEMARSFAEPFGAGELAYQVGLWHDVGKSNPGFQAYLRQCYTNPNHKGRGPDHKAAGATLAQRFLPPLAFLVQGHHGGLKNQTEFQTWYTERLQDRIEGTQASAIDTAIATMRQLLPAIEPSGKLPFPAFLKDKMTAEFFLRMVFSTLVDADFLDTEHHRNPEKATRRGTPVSLETLLARFERDQQQISGQRDDLVSQARHAMYGACCAAAVRPPGLFRLAIPTGGGKTRSAMAFALRHALRHGLRRVIVAVPFISITEQTADVYRRLFQGGDDDNPVVLEHHSGVDGRREEPDDYRPDAVWTRLASENWDAPVVVTTTVQLFESLFANQTGRCRKLHRLARSVIVLDEVQALPTHMLTPILDGLRQLCTHYGATVVLSTATQPAFEYLREFAELPAFDIIPDAARWFTALKRVDYDWRTDESLTWPEVAEQLRVEPQALAVVNTKRDALALLDALGNPDALHLSTLLCGAHRRVVIAAVHARLRAGQPCRLISTQVIEAGVDLDFPLVLRAMGPLDRMIQAAGRCNREGRLARGRVVIFNPSEGGLPPGSYRTATDITRSLVRAGGLNLDDPQTITTYFRRLFTTIGLDGNDIQKLRHAWDFIEVAKQFRMIDEDTEDVIVPYGDASERETVQAAITEIRRQSTGARAALRHLQPYLVAIRAHAAERYRRNGWIEPLVPESKLRLGIWHGRYDAVSGLVVDDDRSLLIF